MTKKEICDEIREDIWDLNEHIIKLELRCPANDDFEKLYMKNLVLGILSYVDLLENGKESD